MSQTVRHGPLFRYQAAILLLCFYLLGPFAISAQCDHLLGAEQNVGKFLDYDLIDTFIPSSFQLELKPNGPFLQQFPSEVELINDSLTIGQRSARAPPVPRFSF